MRKFEDLRVWQEGRIFVHDIYTMMKDCKDFGFKDQLQRASVSIMNNIAEGSESGSDKMFIRYLKITKGSCGEVRSMIYVGEDNGYFTKEQSEDLISRIIHISSATQKLIEYLQKQLSVVN